MAKKQTGFTIVELLIVVVVIAILAAISIVAYTGIQQRAQNAKTIAAVHEWAQIIRMYKADSGGYPLMFTCLGSGYGKGFSGTESTGGECREDAAGSNTNFTVKTAFTTLMSNYVSGPAPTPSFITAGSSSYPWYRGASFNPGYTGSKDRIDFVLAGSSTECPSISGTTLLVRGAYPATNSVICRVAFLDSPF